MRLRDRTVLVTGAGKGIGRATALAFAARGADLVICDVDEDALLVTAADLERAGTRVLARVVNVAKREEMQAFADEVHHDRGALGVLVNNAGVGVAGGVLDTSLEDWEWVVSINLWGVIHGCHFFIPEMIRAGQPGHVVNISSTAGFWASAIMVAYATTKFGVLGMAEAMREELAPHGIGVTAVCPGMINTDIVSSTRYLGEQAGRKRSTEELFRRRAYGPERVGAAIVEAVEQNLAVRPVAPEAHLFYWIKRLAPSPVQDLFRGALRRLAPKE